MFNVLNAFVICFFYTHFVVWFQNAHLTNTKKGKKDDGDEDADTETDTTMVNKGAKSRKI